VREHWRPAGFSTTGQVFTTFRTDFRVFQAVLPGKSGRLQRMLLLLALLLVPAPVAAEKPWPDNPVGLCCSNSKLNCSCPKAPPVVWDACPKWHVGNNTIGTGVYDASGVLRQPDGTW